VPLSIDPAPVDTAAVDPSASDGRHRRRQQNRDAVVDALLGLLDSGSSEPNIAEIAEAAGLSARSVFRYFDDIDDLTRAAIERQQERLAPRFVLDFPTEAPLADRVEQFVAGRLDLLEAMGEVGRVARRRAPMQPLVSSELTRIRSRLRDQVASVFAAELGTMDTARAEQVLAVADVLCSFEAYELLRYDQALSPEAARMALVASLDALFESGVTR
jgi:AcrR family transcriptional regulator